MARFDLTDEEWAIIARLLPKQGRGPKRQDDRRILNGIFYILRTGAPWRNLPERYVRWSCFPVQFFGPAKVYRCL